MAKRMANSVIFFLNVTFFVWFIMCPSTIEGELIAKFSKLIVKNNESGVIHVYKNAILYTMDRPLWVRTKAPNLGWYTIRGRKSSNENFRTVLNMCGLEVEFILFTDKTVKMIVDNKYEYTLVFEKADEAELFSNAIYDSVIKDREGVNRQYPLDEILIKKNNEDDDIIAAPVSLVQRKISDQLFIYYVKSNIIKLIFSTKHFSLDYSTNSQQLSLKLMIIRGVPLDYTYLFQFYRADDFREFLGIATDHEFKDTPDAEPQDTGDWDEQSNECAANYDEDEMDYFLTERELSWDS